MTLEEIYERHVDFVWRSLRGQGVPDDELGDAIQEVFLVVHRTLGAFEGRSSLPTWLFTICRSVARDRRQRAYRRHEIAHPARMDEPVDARADTAARAEHNDRLLQLEAILARMEPDLRDVFVLFEIEDLTGEEISRGLSIPLGTVYSRMQLARKAFGRAAARIDTGKQAPSAHDGRGVRAGGRA